jgi:predicted phage-related endonuclease
MTVERHAITDRASWLAMRQQDLTASDLGAVAGIDPYRSPLQIFRQKRGEVPQTVENNIMRRGRWLEPAVLFALRERYPDWRIDMAGFYLRDPEIRLGATPDAIAVVNGDRVNVQLKVITRSAYDRDWSDGSAPPSYVVQTMAEGMLLDADRSILAALVLDTYSADLEVRDVPRRPDAEALIRQAAVRFWADVDADRPPQPDYSRDRDTLAAMYPPRPELDPLDLSADNHIRELLADRSRLKGEIKAAGEQCDQVDAEIIDKLKGAPAAVCDGWRISWKEETRAEYTVKASTRCALRITEPKSREKAA